MPRVAIIVGSASSESASGIPTLPISDRGAISLAMAKFEGRVCAYAADSVARCYAQAAGVEIVDEISNQDISGADVTLVGRGGCGELGDALPARLAEQSGAALVYDVIELQPETDRLVVTRDLGRGARDLLSVRGRVILVVADSVARGPYVSRYRMNTQRTATEKMPAQRESNRFEWQSATPRVRLGDHDSRVTGCAVERMNALFGMGKTRENTASLVRGGAAECARHLLRYLSHHGLVERKAIDESQSAPGRAVASQPAERQPQQSALGAAPVPVRVRRRPRLLEGRSLAARGPFEIGVDR
jgi:hypothetical protein